MRSQTKPSKRDPWQTLSAIVGECVWYVRRSSNNELRMDFGSPSLHLRDPSPPKTRTSREIVDALERRVVVPTGDWHLSIENGFWSVKTKRDSCNRFDSAHDHVDHTLRQLEGQKLTSVRYDEHSREWRFEFDLEGILSIAPSGDPQESKVEWILFFADGTNISWPNKMAVMKDGPGHPRGGTKPSTSKISRSLRQDK